jgi:hypothetical protein
LGTRHITIVELKEEYRVAQYGQWDGYPGGQGLTVFNFIKENLSAPEDIEEFKTIIDSTRFLTSQELQDRWVECGADPESDMVSMDVSHAFMKKYPELSRDTGAEVLALILNEDARLLKDSIDFVGDSLFCEWGWLINLDTEELEVYGGFNKEPLTDADKFHGVKQDNEDYCPIKMSHKFSFEKLHNMSEEDFIEQFSNEDDGASV